MPRRLLLLGLVLTAMVAVAALSRKEKPRLLLLDWAARARTAPPPVAVLIELGLKDTRPTVYAGRAMVHGAKIVERQGYRFRAQDRLTPPDGWDVSSHRAMRLPPGNPVLARIEGISTVGVVLHLTDVAADATLTLLPREDQGAKTVVPLQEVLAGKARSVWGDTGHFTGMADWLQRGVNTTAVTTSSFTVLVGG